MMKRNLARTIKERDSNNTNKIVCKAYEHMIKSYETSIMFLESQIAAKRILVPYKKIFYRVRRLWNKAK